MRYIERMSTTQHASDFIDARKFEEIFSLSRRTFFKLISENKLAAYKLSKRKTLVKRADVERLLEASRTSSNVDQIVEDVMGELSDAR
jgi:excisionase family DNA binding protein